MNIVKIHNVETGEIIEREMTAEEIAEREATNQALIIETELKAQAEAKRAAALAKLEALGLDEDDLKALGL